MAYQTTVNNKLGLGVPGQRYDDAPMVAKAYTIVSVSAAYNIVGATAFSYTSEGIVQAGNASGSLVFAGLLVNPHVYASYGTTGDALAATMTLPNNVVGEFAREGHFIVTLPAAANIGDLVIFDNTTGAIATIAPAASLPSLKTFAYARVIEKTVAGAGLGIIELNPTLHIPT